MRTNPAPAAPLTAQRAPQNLGFRTGVPDWLSHYGALGLFSVAMVDSSVIPLPLPGSTDLLLMWLVSQHGNPWILAASAILGSILGGYTSWIAGRRGGKTALRKYCSGRMFAVTTHWAERHTLLSVFLPAMLPPPFPLSAFLVVSGVMGLSRKRFLCAYTTARTLRYGFVTWIAVAYGHGAVRLWSGALQKWSPILLFVSSAIVLISVLAWLWNCYRKNHRFAENASTTDGFGDVADDLVETLAG